MAKKTKAKMTQDLTPMNDFVLVAPQEKQTKTAGGLYLPVEMSQTEGLGYEKGKVLAVGPGRLHPNSGVRIPVEVKVGDVVLYDQGLLFDDPLERILVPEQAILAIEG